MEGRSTTRSTILVGRGLATLALGLGYWLYAFGGTEVQAQQGECPSPRLIDEITGSGNQDSPPFETTTDSFRVSYEVNAPSEDAAFYADVESLDEDNPIFNAGISQQGSGTGETFVNEEPGRYSLGIITGGETSYTLRIEECGEGGEANPGEGKSGEGTSPPKTTSQPAPKTPATPPKTPSPAPKTPSPAPKTPTPAPKDSGTLMNAGGPTSEPMPMMPNGSCPREFPELRDGACYPQ
jgi:hypothetical protein